MTSQLDSTTSSREAVETWIPYETPFGVGWIGEVGGRVDRIVLPGMQPPEGVEPDDDAASDLGAALASYFSGSGPLPDGRRFIDDASVTELDTAIYRTVTAIPAGHTMTYSEVADAVGRPGAARAVGAAMARNRFAPAIPCHRVVGADGSLRGYAGGLELKRALLTMEATHA